MTSVAVPESTPERLFSAKEPTFSAEKVYVSPVPNRRSSLPARMESLSTGTLAAAL